MLSELVHLMLVHIVCQLFEHLEKKYNAPSQYFVVLEFHPPNNRVKIQGNWRGKNQGFAVPRKVQTRVSECRMQRVWR